MEVVVASSTVQPLFSINPSFGNVPAHQYDRRLVLELTVLDYFRYRCRNQVFLHWGKDHTFLLEGKSVKLKVFHQFRDILLRTLDSQNTLEMFLIRNSSNKIGSEGFP